MGMICALGCSRNKERTDTQNNSFDNIHFMFSKEIIITNNITIIIKY